MIATKEKTLKELQLNKGFKLNSIKSQTSVHKDMIILKFSQLESKKHLKDIRYDLILSESNLNGRTFIELMTDILVPVPDKETVEKRYFKKNRQGTIHFRLRSSEHSVECIRSRKSPYTLEGYIGNSKSANLTSVYRLVDGFPFGDCGHNAEHSLVMKFFIEDGIRKLNMLVILNSPYDTNLLDQKHRKGSFNSYLL